MMLFVLLILLNVLLVNFQSALLCHRTDGAAGGVLQTVSDR